MDYVEKVSSARPNLKPGSLKSYHSAFKKAVNTGKDIQNDALGVIEALADVSLTTRRNVYNAVAVYLEAIDDNDTAKIYHTERDKLNEEYVKQNESGIISDKQSPNFISYDELISYTHKVRADIKDNQQLHMIFAILTFLIHRPLRNDLAMVKLINRRSWKKLTDEEKDQCYIIFEGGGGTKCTFYCNQYATTKTRPQEILDVDGRARIELHKYIRTWKIQSGEVLFPISKNGLSQLLIRTSQKYIGKNISTNIIRKIISSHKFLDKKVEQEAHSKSIGHSVNTENLIYVKSMKEEQLPE